MSISHPPSSPRSDGHPPVGHPQMHHPVLKNAKVLQSDYKWMRNLISAYSKFINLTIFEYRPILFIFSFFSKSHKKYKLELEEIDRADTSIKQKITDNTLIFGGETEEKYNDLATQFEKWKSDNPPSSSSPAKILWYSKSDSLGAARSFKQQFEKEKPYNVAITNFANGVRVGGADSCGGRGSQEEFLIRANPLLRVSLEHASGKADPAIKELTGRYLSYYGAVVSKDIPPMTKETDQETFNFISITAPDLRDGFRSEGAYLTLQASSELIEEILYRKIAVAMMSAAITGHNVLELGAIGCGAFRNDPKMVAKVIKELINEERFKGVFDYIILPIGKKDNNRIPFTEIIGRPRPTSAEWEIG